MTDKELETRLFGIDNLLLHKQPKWLMEQVAKLPDGSAILEIGTHCGFATAAMALACVGTTKRIYTIDTNAAKTRIAREHWKRHVLDGVIFAFNFDSSELLKHAVNLKWPPFAFAFIDGAHSYESALLDYLQIKMLMAPNGRIAFHDVIPSWPDILRLWETRVSNELAQIEVCESISSGIV